MCSGCCFIDFGAAAIHRRPPEPLWVARRQRPVVDPVIGLIIKTKPGCRYQNRASPPDQVHRTDAGWVPAAFQVCRAEGGQGGEGGGAGDRGLAVTSKHYRACASVSKEWRHRSLLQQAIETHS